MSLASYTFLSTSDVWEKLVPPADRVDEYNEAMEVWINGCTLALERLLRRFVKARDFDTYQDGTGLNYLNLKNYPINTLTSVTIETPDLLTSYSISVDRADKELVYDSKNGKLTLLPNAPVSYFLCGTQNIRLVYNAGFSDLDVFKPAIVEMITIIWAEQGTNPRLQQWTSTVGTSFFEGRFNPKQLSYQTQLLIETYRSYDV